MTRCIISLARAPIVMAAIVFGLAQPAPTRAGTCQTTPDQSESRRLPVPPGALELSSDGRTILPASGAKAGTPVSIHLRLQAEPPFKCQSESPVSGEYEMVFAPLGRFVTPAVLDGDPVSGVPAEGGGLLFTSPTNSRTRFVVFNLLQRTWNGKEDSCAKELEALLNTNPADEELAKEIEAKRAALGTNQARLDTLKGSEAMVKQLTAQVQSLANDRAVQRLVDLQEEYRQLEAEIADVQQQARTLKKEVADAVARDAKNLAPFTSREALESRLKKMQLPRKERRLVKIGALAVDPNLKAVYYDFAGWAGTGGAGSMPSLGAMPAIHHGDSVYAVVTNVNPTDHPYPFILEVDAQPGKAINAAPSRPTFAPGATLAEAPGVTPTGLDKAYADVFLPVEGDFAPNDLLKVSISTLRPDDQHEGKLKSVVLVDKAKYPQLRALYRYNFNAGVFASRLRDPQFRKVKTVADNPETKEVNEAVYRTDVTFKDPEVKPGFAFTYYLKPVDIRAPVLWERYLPNPTVGFAFSNPASDVFLGFSHEIFRNTQLFWGRHWGSVNTAIQRNAIDEEKDASPPPTRTVRKWAWSWGLTFNLDVVTKIFK